MVTLARKREINNKSQNKKRERIRKIVIEAKAGGCVECGEMRYPCLQFHHTNPENKKGTIQKLSSQSKSIEKIQEEIKKCIVLCANCHAMLHYNERQEKLKEI